MTFARRSPYHLVLLAFCFTISCISHSLAASLLCLRPFEVHIGRNIYIEQANSRDRTNETEIAVRPSTCYDNLLYYLKPAITGPIPASACKKSENDCLLVLLGNDTGRKPKIRIYLEGPFSRAKPEDERLREPVERLLDDSYKTTFDHSSSYSVNTDQSRLLACNRSGFGTVTVCKLYFDIVPQTLSAEVTFAPRADQRLSDVEDRVRSSVQMK